MQGLKISLGLVVRNEASHIVACLESIKLAAGSSLFELIVVDNNSDDETLSLVEQWANAALPFSFQIVKLDTNNMAVARNQILNIAAGEWIYFTDADCRLQTDSWRHLVTHLYSNASAGIARKVALGGGNITPKAQTFVSEGLHHMAHYWLAHMGSIQAKSPQEMSKVAVLSACNLLVYAPAARECGGFDVTYSRVGEDLSLSHRLTKAGHKLYSVPRIDVLHLQDRGLIRWCRKMFFYGRAQVHVAAKYPRHFFGLRGLQFLAVILFFVLMIALPVFALGLLVFYFLTLLLISKNLDFSAIKGVCFVFITHGFYAIGELSAILTLPIFALKIFPVKMPALEKQ